MIFRVCRAISISVASAPPKNRAFTFQLEDDHAVVVACCEEGEGRVGGDDPVAVVLTAKCVETGAL